MDIPFDLIDVFDHIAEQLEQWPEQNPLTEKLRVFDVIMKGDSAISNGGIAAFYERGNIYSEFISCLRIVGIEGASDVFFALEGKCPGFLATPDEEKIQILNQLSNADWNFLPSISEIYYENTANIAIALCRYIISGKAKLSLSTHDLSILTKFIANG